MAIAQPSRPGSRTRWWWIAAILLGVPLVGGFVLHSISFGWRGTTPPWPDSYLFIADGAAVNAIVALHMMLGATAMLLIPFQLVATIRIRWPAVHRVCGRLVIAGAVATAIGGLLYIAVRGTKGGWPMDTGFLLYGALMIIAAVQTVSHAMARRIARHRRWALRLLVLLMGSWLYRAHYVAWYVATDGLWSELPAHTGGFDRVQNFAFYLPYLLALELWLRRSKRSTAFAR